MRAPTVFVGVIPIVMCCHLMLNLREGYEKPSRIVTTQKAECPEWSSRFHELPLDRGLDSMGLPRFSGKRLVAPQFWSLICSL